MLNHKGPRIGLCSTPNLISSQELYDIFTFVIRHLFFNSLNAKVSII